jgi:nitrate reductase NapAB chaperone NapD
MVISGVLVVVKPEHQSQVRAALEMFPWAEVHHEDPGGRIVIIIEADDTEQAIARLQEVKELPRVILAEMAEHYFGDELGQ